MYPLQQLRLKRLFPHSVAGLHSGARLCQLFTLHVSISTMSEHGNEEEPYYCLCPGCPQCHITKKHSQCQQFAKSGSKTRIQNGEIVKSELRCKFCWALIGKGLEDRSEDTAMHEKATASEDREGSMSAAARTDASENRTEDTRMHDAAAASEDWASSVLAAARQEREPRRMVTTESHAVANADDAPQHIPGPDINELRDHSQQLEQSIEELSRRVSRLEGKIEDVSWYVRQIWWYMQDASKVGSPCLNAGSTACTYYCRPFPSGS